MTTQTQQIEENAQRREASGFWNENATWPPPSHEYTVARAGELFQSLAIHDAEVGRDWRNWSREREEEDADARGNFNDEYATQQERY